MTGNLENYKQRGLIFRTIANIFKDIEERQDHAFKVKISYMEIHNEQIIDLLSVGETSENLIVVDQGKSKNGGVKIKGTHFITKGLSQKPASSEEEALNLLFQGESIRSLLEHQMGKSSSRSHSIFTIYVESRLKAESADKTTTSKLNLVDLAGSDRLSKQSSFEESLETKCTHS
jgi:kinesin family member 6/9